MNTEKTKKWGLFFNKLGHDFIHTLYPNACLICDKEIVLQSLQICPICASELKYTHYEKYNEPTNLDKLFWGRVQITGTYALLYFNEAGSVQKLLHALKYKNNPKIGHFYGEQLGNMLKQLEVFADADALVPVPLHPKKKFIRGYNQAHEIALGVAASSEIPVRDDLLKRSVFTESQTKHNRFSRWENMQNRFALQRKHKTVPKHIVLIDDVVTTGSTLESIAKMLFDNYPNVKISIATIAVAV